MGIAKVALIGFSVFILFSIGLTSQLAYGTISASGGTNGVSATAHSVFPCPPAIPVTSEDGCAEDIIETVTFCPTCGPWVKTFDATSVFSPTAPFGSVIHVHEFLTVQGVDWNDWHERIVTPDWIYVINPNIPTPVITTPAGVSSTIVPMNPNELWIDFDPPILESQTAPQLTIFKYMKCDNANGCDAVVVVEQFPTVDVKIGGTLIPIDTTTLLLAGVQSISMWMIPVVAAGVAIGIFVIKRRK